MSPTSSIDKLCINTVRFLAADSVERAGVGHLGTPLGAAPMAFVLWDRFLRHDPEDPNWPDRDRFILSCGHASLLQYALLHLTGYDLPLAEFKRFRQWGSMTPGHPELGLTPGIEATTGPLGQGISFAVGMALVERHLAHRYNQQDFELFNHRTYALVSDGDLQEGVSAEAASLAGTLGLSNLIVLYDDNDMQIEGGSDIAFREDVTGRFKAYGWHVIEHVVGEDVNAIESALESAKSERERPSLIAVQTRIGFGSPVENMPQAHHGPLGPEGLRTTKSNLEWAYDESFFVPDEVRSHFSVRATQLKQDRLAWNNLWRAYKEAYPDLAKELAAGLSGDLPVGWNQNLKEIGSTLTSPIAPRKASEKVLNVLARRIPTLIGGSADLGPSTCTYIEGESDFSAEDPSGRILHFGVREHAMGAIAVGMTLHGGVRPFIATYLAFSDYLRPSLRLSAMMSQPVIYIFTHDSIAVGRDGPTHQAVEQIMSLRSVPNLVVLRPADTGEVVEAWEYALERNAGPTAILLARQSLPQLDRQRKVDDAGVHQGGYILWESANKPIEIALIATGSEVHLAQSVGQTLDQDGVGVRVVSMPSWEVFDAQPASHRERVIPSDLKTRLSIEAGITVGWEHYVGLEGDSLGVDTYGESAGEEDLFQHFGLTEESILEKAHQLLS